MAGRYCAATALLLTAFTAAPLAARQGADPRTAAPNDTILVVPSTRYDANWLHRRLLGDLNRELWTIPVTAEVLDLAGFAGGLVPTERGGGAQTPSLRFAAGDGNEYRFRSLLKDPSQGLDPQLRNGIVAAVLEDQVASLFPLSAMVVSPLLDAAGVLHAIPRLVVLPNDAVLGEFRDEFAGALGWIEVQPDEGDDGAPGFAGSGSVTGSDAVLERLEESSENRVDALVFLRARLVDVFVGDWDRHPDQWRWAAFEEEGGLRWEPVPRDRDWALNRIDGLVMRLTRSRFIQFVSFGNEYGSIMGTVWNGRALDRMLLSELTREDFVSVATELQQRLSDDVITSAVGLLPPTYPDAVRTALVDALRNRRDGLVEVALEYYDILAGWVDVWGTDQPELARVERLAGGRVRVSVADLPGGARFARDPFFDRVFESDETREVRIYMRGANDSVEVSGELEGPIKIRVIGGGGSDVLVDRTSGREVRFYDAAGDNRFVLAEHTRLDQSEYVEPADLESATHRARPRDWGSRWYMFPQALIDTDIGLAFGQTWEWQDYGFRFFPYRNRFRAIYAINPVRLGSRGSLSWEFPIGRRGVGGLVELQGVSRDVRWYYGLGNETPATFDRTFYRADRAAVSAAAGLSYRPADRLTFELTPVFWHSVAVDRDEPTLIETTRPPELDAVSQAGLVLRMELDRRDSVVVARRGFRVELETKLVPELLDSEHAYVVASGRASINFPLGAPVLSFAGGGAHLFGEAPYFEWPQLGGRENLRGWVTDRFTGRSTVFGSAHFRTALFGISALVPGTLGMTALVDAGRVFAEGESSRRVHVGYGSGLWVSMVRSDLLVSLNAVRSREGIGLYLTFDFPY